MEQKETIVALATPPGRSAIAVIRMSGNDCFQILSRIIQEDRRYEFSDKKLLLLDLTRTVNHCITPIDQCVVLPYFAPNSYTGENVVEIFSHGNPVITNLIVESLIANGARIAAAGEFTERAFLNGKVDLAQAESIDALIMANTSEEISLVHRHYSGQFSQMVDGLRQQLLELMALLELELDFSDEDVEFASRPRLLNLLSDCENILQKLLRSYQRSHIIREGFSVAITGRPNVGKSSLLNLLLKKERSIVTEIAGTTRDIIREQIDIAGHKFVFTDTAGIHQTDNLVEKEGIRRSRKTINEAQLVLFMIDGSDTLTEDDWLLRNEFLKLQKTDGKEFFLLINKIDMKNLKMPDQFKKFISSFRVFEISCTKNTGFPQLETALVETVLIATKAEEQSVVAIINARQKNIIENALKCILDAKNHFKEGLTQEFISADIRHTLNFLGELTGEISTEDVLSQIFENFCIGK